MKLKLALIKDYNNISLKSVGRVGDNDIRNQIQESIVGNVWKNGTHMGFLSPWTVSTLKRNDPLGKEISSYSVFAYASGL